MNQRLKKIKSHFFKPCEFSAASHPLPLVQELLGVAAVQLSHSPLPLRLVFDALVLADGFAVLHGHLGLVGSHLFALPAIARIVFVKYFFCVKYFFIIFISLSPTDFRSLRNLLFGKTGGFILGLFLFIC